MIKQSWIFHLINAAKLINFNQQYCGRLHEIFHLPHPIANYYIGALKIHDAIISWKNLQQNIIMKVNRLYFLLGKVETS